MNRTAALLSILLALPAGLFAQDQGATALAPLQGSWIAISADGKDLPAGVPIGLTVTGDKYREMHDGRLYGSGNEKVDASKKPAWRLTRLEPRGYGPQRHREARKR